MVGVADELAAVTMPPVAAAGFVVGVRLMARYDTLGEAGRDISVCWNGFGAFWRNVFS